MWKKYNKKELNLGRETLMLNSHPVQQKRCVYCFQKGAPEGADMDRGPRSARDYGY